MTTTNLFSVKGKVALVTGASSGFGRHFAEVLAREGAKVGLAARRAEVLESVAADIRNSGGTAAVAKLDVADGASVQQAVQSIEAALGRIDILVNNSGASIAKPLLEQTEQDFDAVVDVNLKGAFLVATEVARRMRADGKGGSIINIESILSFRQAGHVAPYAASKAGLTQLTKAMALELRRIRDYADRCTEDAQSCEVSSVGCGIVWLLQLVQERQQLPRRAIFAWLAIDRRRFCQYLFSQDEIGVEIHLSGINRLMSEPESDRVLLNASVQQIHRHRVAQAVESDPLLTDRWTGLRCDGHMLIQKMLNGICTQSAASHTREDQIGTLHARLIEPCLQHRCDRPAKWNRTFLSPLSNDLQICGSTERQVLARKPCHFGQPQAGLHCEQHQGVVTTSSPRPPVRCAEKRLNLGRVKKLMSLRV